MRRLQAARENLIGLAPPAFDPARCDVALPADDCSVADIFVLARIDAGGSGTLENVCAAYFGP